MGGSNANDNVSVMPKKGRKKEEETLWTRGTGKAPELSRERTGRAPEFSRERTGKTAEFSGEKRGGQDASDLDRAGKAAEFSREKRGRPDASDLDRVGAKFVGQTPEGDGGSPARAETPCVGRTDKLAFSCGYWLGIA